VFGCEDGGVGEEGVGGRGESGHEGGEGVEEEGGG